MLLNTCPVFIYLFNAQYNDQTMDQNCLIPVQSEVLRKAGNDLLG